VYFVSEVLIESKKYYSNMEKICYAVIRSARKLHHYFKAHTIKVLANQPLNDIFGNRASSSRISKWMMELSEYVVDFEK
jgi:diketogulonate reductase-like aldo/keto reductase